MSRAFRRGLWMADASGGAGGSPPAAGGWFDELIPTPPTPAELTSGSGVVRNVATLAEFQAARTAASPGDVINVTGVISGINESGAVAKWDGRVGHIDGTAANPIVITCSGSGKFSSPTSWNTGSQFPSQFDVINVDHVHLVNVVGEGGQFGLRFISAGGSAASPAKIEHCTCTGARDANVYVGTLSDVAGSAKGYVSIKYNMIGSSPGTVDFDEGVYIGTGATSFYWQDTTHDVEVAYNDIGSVRGDGVDIKLGCYNINVHHNKIHDIGGAYGAGVTTGATSGDPGTNPNMARDPNITIHNNWIWNIGWYGSSTYATAHAINASHSGTQVYNNVIWNLKSDEGPIGVRVALYVANTSHPIDIYNNTVWEDGGNALSFFNGGGSGPSVTWRNNLTGDGSQSSQTVTSGDFVGPVPAFNAGPGSANEEADAGNGPGSGFFLDSGSSAIGAATSTVPATDIIGTSRPQGVGSDRGAYEYTT
jgi:hypothetical protein